MSLSPWRKKMQKPTLPDEAKQKLRRLRDDFPYYASQLLRIRTKEGQLRPFALNSTQDRIDGAIERLKSEGKPIRLIVLKARQMGVSTFTEGRIFHATTMRKLTSSLIVAHEEEASTNLFRMSKLYYDELPAAMKPMQKTSNAKELVFENPTQDAREKQKNPGLRSRIRIASANNLGAGRSDTVHMLHASEVAFWRDAETVMLGIMQSVPNLPSTMVILESTPNGVGGYFYDQWQRAKRGESDFIPLFFPWFEHHEYRMEMTQEEKEAWEVYVNGEVE